jgi:peptidoglycan/LPS O-acetylase OafA/YrhL
LAGVFFLIAQIEFGQIVREAIPTLGFYSNVPIAREIKYFDYSSKFYFFTHSWSLSVEIQFYLIVPLFFLLFDACLSKVRPALQMFVVALIPILSFLHQIYASDDMAHMMLSARLWQFFAGFGAHFVYEQTSRIASEKNKILNDLLVIGGLCFLFVYGFMPQINRTLVILLTSFIVARSNQNSWLWNSRLFTSLGDVSYSIYLIHWPLFTWHRYANMESYAAGREADLLSKTPLI